MPKWEASFYNKLERKRVKCELCPHGCVIGEGCQGICRVRVNEDGRLVSLNYAEVASLALDPIEKKPLYHFYPGTLILSVGTWGCNMTCGFCQNYQLAHQNPPTRALLPAELLGLAKMTVQEGSIGVAFTYNEPSIWYEYVRDCAEFLKKNSFKVVLVSNGFIAEEPLQQLIPFVDAINIDVKSFREDFYRKNCQARLSEVKRSVEIACQSCHVEITTLIIPGENDNLDEISRLASWVAGLNADIPLHLSRYHPAYKFTIESTTEQVLQQAYDAAKEYLNFVYMGNLKVTTNNTYCKFCNYKLISRDEYLVINTGLRQGFCRNCGHKIDYIIQ